MSATGPLSVGFKKKMVDYDQHVWIFHQLCHQFSVFVDVLLHVSQMKNE